MQGHQSYQPQLFSVFSMEALIPKDHLLRQIDSKIDFEFVREMTAPLYCQDNGRPSIDPILFVRICLLTYLYNIHLTDKFAKKYNTIWHIDGFADLRLKTPFWTTQV